MPDTPGAVLKLVATTLISTVGGAAGPLFGTAFLRAATAVGDADDAGRAPRWSTALTAARDGVVARGKAESGDKTMVDALTPAVTAAKAAADGGGGVARGAGRGRRGRHGGRRGDHPMQARKGRASYLGERSIGHPDPGAHQHRRTCCRHSPPRRAPIGRTAKGTTVTVGLVLVSHSRSWRQGLADVAAQMAPSVTIAPAGGLEDGGSARRST